MLLNESLRTEMDQSVLCWLATVSSDGTPNVSPKEIFAPYDESAMVIADIASPGSVRNVRANPKVCVSFIDVFRQRGFKIAGTAKVLAPDEEAFLQYRPELFKKAGEAFPIRNIILVDIERVSRIWAPSYTLFPQRSEEELAREAYRRYGVKPLG